jgi:probable rRNA maturation factor
MTNSTYPSISLQYVSKNGFIPAENEFIDWINIISQTIEIKGKYITIRIADASESRELNKQFLGQDRPTNVLSFPSELPKDIEPDYLGDIVICAPIVEAEAGAQNKSVRAHWAHMLVHGVLHLKGYDHLLAGAAEEMESLETRILADIGFPDPYEDQV